MRQIPATCSFLLLALLLPRTAPAQAPAPADLFQEGNARYQKGEFPSAEQAYRGMISQGIDSGAVYYNLANACFKQAKLGEAIYYWEKAVRKLPGNSDARENLELARQMIVDRIEVPEDPLPVRWLSAALHRFTIVQESLAALLLFVFGNLLLSAYLLARKPRPALVALVSCLCVACLFLLTACSAAWKIYERTYRRQGVVAAQVVEVRSGPGKDYLTVATVHEGIQVRVRGEGAEWYQISLPNGWSGWLPKSSVLVH